MTGKPDKEIEVRVKFTQTKVVDDHRRGTEDEERYDAGKSYKLPLASAEHWLRRRACTLAKRSKSKEGEDDKNDDDDTDESTDEPQHVGGGWYLMPTGEKVKGKEAAGLT